MSHGHGHGQLARHRSSSSASGRPYTRSTTPSNTLDNPLAHLNFQACAATASIFLYAQGSTILCLHHDTLDLERKFEKHKAPVVLITVDNVSERGAGRLVLSYDVEGTAIVWDLFTGADISSFQSFQTLTVAAWMKNGHVVFGQCAWVVAKIMLRRWRCKGWC